MTTKYDALVQAVRSMRELDETDSVIALMRAAEDLVDESPTVADVSDGYHTLNDLYRHRMLLNAALFNTWHRHLPGLAVHKSRTHWDEANDPMYPGFFIVVARLPAGQISYHYPIEHWDLFDIEEWSSPAAYDGHSAADVEARIEAWLLR